MKTKTTLWDAAEHLKTKEDMAAYVACALEEGDSALIAAALGDIARAQGMTKIAKRTGLGRESLYKTLSREGNPAFATVLKVFNSVGLKLKAVPDDEASRTRRWNTTPRAAAHLSRDVRQEKKCRLYGASRTR